MNVSHQNGTFMTAYSISTRENKTAENEVCAPVRKGSHSSLAAAVKGDFWGTLCSESLGLESCETLIPQVSQKA